jgi:hypothetical protein
MAMLESIPVRVFDSPYLRRDFQRQADLLAKTLERRKFALPNALLG